MFCRNTSPRKVELIPHSASWVLRRVRQIEAKHRDEWAAPCSLRSLEFSLQKNGWKRQRGRKEQLADHQHVEDPPQQDQKSRFLTQSPESVKGPNEHTEVTLHMVKMVVQAGFAPHRTHILAGSTSSGTQGQGCLRNLTLCPDAAALTSWGNWPSTNYFLIASCMLSTS